MCDDKLEDTSMLQRFADNLPASQKCRINTWKKQINKAEVNKVLVTGKEEKPLDKFYSRSELKCFESLLFRNPVIKLQLKTYHVATGFDRHYVHF